MKASSSVIAVSWLAVASERKETAWGCAGSDPCIVATTAILNLPKRQRQPDYAQGVLNVVIVHYA
jgi:hypothetical protein